MATPLTQSIQSELDAINSEYEAHFAGQSRATRDLSKLDQLTSRIKALVARIDAIPAAARGGDLNELRTSADEQRKLFEGERGQIERAKKLGPTLERFAPLASAANFTFARYTRHFAGQGRETRDLELLDDMIDELVRVEKDMTNVINQSPTDEFRNDRNIVQQNLEMYRKEREEVAKAQSAGSPEARAERTAALANSQFELYRLHFAGQNRLTRRPQLLQRVIKSLERIQGIMKDVEKTGYAPDFNKGNVDIVDQNLAMYRSELQEIRKTKEQASLDDLSGNLGDAANQLFAEYREGFAGKNRTQVDQKLLSSICDRLYEVYRQMRDIDRTKKVEMNTKNLEIVTDQLSLFSREFDLIGEAKKAAGRLAQPGGRGALAGLLPALAPVYTGGLMTAYEAVIGLEVHAQLLTASKLFCSCPTSFGAPPNTHVCPVCLGLPGALPVLNARVVELAARAALALGLTVHERSLFARKNYFYPDLPKGYQISQYDRPLATDGALEIELESGELRRVGIQRIHIEEDAGKNLHGHGGDSIVDLNRAGTPLVEIVSAPDLRSGQEAAAYLKALRDVLMFLGVNDGNLEEGSFRCDANVSIRPRGSQTLGTRCEIKNVNSFRFVQRAIEHEALRQEQVLAAGGRIEQETRGWNERDGRTFSLRSKEEAHDYRYFPDPDLPPLVVDRPALDALKASLPEPPETKRERYRQKLGLTPYAAGVLTGHPRVAAFFEEATALFGGDANKAANFVQSEVLAEVTYRGLDATFPVTPAQVAALLRLVDAGTISGKQAKEVYAAVVGTDRDPAEVVRERGLEVIRDEASLEALCRRIVDENPRQVAAYRGGKTGLLGYFVGAAMKETKGSASPAMVNAILKRLLEA